jgi:uncharacterized membrane protein YraQ (UPF0718 family)
MPIRLLTIILGLTLWVAFAFGMASQASAQSNNQIVNGLCQGANLRFSDNPSSSSCDSNGQSITDKINNFLKHLINIFSAVIGVVAVVMIIFGGFRYITSGGNDNSVTSAKNTILYAIIGLVIVALAQLLVRFVLKLASS